MNINAQLYFSVLFLIISVGGFGQTIANGGFERVGPPKYCVSPVYYECENDAGQVFDGFSPVFDLALAPHGCIAGGENWANQLGAHEGEGYVYFYAGADKLIAPDRYFVGNETLDLCVWYAGPQWPCELGQDGSECYFSYGLDGGRLGGNVPVPCGTAWTEYCMSLEMTTGVHNVSIWSGGKARYSLWFDDWDVTINSLFEVDIGLDTLLCAGDTLVLDVTMPGATYEWFDGSTDPIYIVRGSGLYWVEVTTDEGTSAGSLNVKYWAYPIVELEEDLIICEEDEEVELDVSSSATTTLWPDGTTYSWSTGASSSVIVTEGEGIYWVDVERGGCVTRDSIEINYFDCDLRLNIPNIFTPNNDGVNDSFSFSNIEEFEEVSIFVMNRWGELMYQGSESWDGTYRNSPCSEGVYFWKIEYQTQLGEIFELNGNVQLIR